MVANRSRFALFAECGRRNSQLGNRLTGVSSATYNA